MIATTLWGLSLIVADANEMIYGPDEYAHGSDMGMVKFIVIVGAMAFLLGVPLYPKLSEWHDDWRNRRTRHNKKRAGYLAAWREKRSQKRNKGDEGGKP